MARSASVISELSFLKARAQHVVSVNPSQRVTELGPWCEVITKIIIALNDTAPSLLEAQLLISSALRVQVYKAKGEAKWLWVLRRSVVIWDGTGCLLHARLLESYHLLVGCV